MPKEKLITILGPTASGKTALGVYLAKELGSVVISGDAFQVYRRMDIGTAKVTKAEAEGVPHFLVDCLEPTESYSAADFQGKAKATNVCFYKYGIRTDTFYTFKRNDIFYVVSEQPT